VTLVQSKSDQYADDVIALATSEFRLRQIIKDLEISLQSRPDDADALMVLGMALFRIGRQEDGINKMKYSVHLNPAATGVGNLIKSLTANCKYEEAWDVTLKYSVETSLFDIVLCDHYEVLKDDFDKPFKDSLTEISRLILNITPYGSSYTVEVDEEDGATIVDIKADIPAPTESVFDMYCTLTKGMANKFSSEVLMRITPSFASSL